MANPAPGFARHPEHTLQISAPVHAVRVCLGDSMVGDTRAAVRVRESGCADRYYLPAADVEQSCLTSTDTHSHCPFKGEARYWTISAGGAEVSDGAWAYDRPYDEARALAGNVAFYGDRFSVDVIAEDD